MRHAAADGWLRRQPLTAREALPPPEPAAADPVFGPQCVRGEREYGQVWHRCAEHETSWRGDSPCWACEGEAASG